MNITSWAPILCIPLAMGLGYVLWRLRFKTSRGSLLFMVSIGLMLLALAGPVWRPTDQESSPEATNLLFVDISPSMPEALCDELLKQAKEQMSTAEVIPFAERIFPKLDLASVSSCADLGKSVPSGREHPQTNLTQVVEYAASYPETRSYLISDGVETTGDVLKALATVRQDRPTFGVSVLLPKAWPQPQKLRISSIAAPVLVDEGAQVAVAVTVQNGTGRQQEDLTLAISQDSSTLRTDELTLKSQESQVTTVQSKRVPLEGAVLEAVLRQRGQVIDRRKVFTTARPKEKVLLISQGKEGAWIEQILSDNGISVEERSPSSLTLAEVQASSVKGVILNNVPYQKLSATIGSTIAARVRTGMGLVMSGGPQSFGYGGYQGTPLETVLPVKLLPPRAQEKRVNVAIALVLDKSASMAQEQRMDFAKEAAREVVRTLKDEDYIGIIGFDATPFVAVRMGRLGEIRKSALEMIGRIYPAQNTMLLPALERARGALLPVPAGRKHIIVLTDGKLPDAGPYYPEFVRQLRERGITLSTVLVGTESDTSLMEEMATVGGGKFHQTRDARSLPRIFISDVTVATGKRASIDLQQYMPQRGAALQSTSLDELPSVRAFVETEPRPEATTEYVLRSEGKEYPLLASWQVDQGRTVAFTSDLFGVWTPQWASWSMVATFVKQIVLWTTRGGAGKGRQVGIDARVFFARGKVIFDVTDYGEQPADGTSLRGTVHGAGMGSREVRPQLLAPGRMQFEVVPTQAGEVVLELQRDSSAEPLQLRFAVEERMVQEQEFDGVDAVVLDTLARISGAAEAATATISRKDVPIKPLDFIVLLFASMFYVLAVYRREQR